MKTLSKSFLITFLLLLSLSACVKENNVDFTQTDQINLNPELNGSLISFTSTLADFGDVNNLPFDGFEFNTPIDAFNNATVQNELVGLTFKFDFENTFDRDFEFTFNFMDVNNVILFSKVINVTKKGTTSQDVVVEGLDANQIKNTSKIGIQVSVVNSNPPNTIDNTSGAFVSLKLGATFDFSSSQQASASLIDIIASLPDLTTFDNGNLPFTHFEFETTLDIFNNINIQNNLTKTAFHFEIENTFNRDFQLDFQFMDDQNQVTFNMPISINKTSNTTYDVVVEGVELVNLKKSTQVKITADVINATTIDNTPGAFIKFKSSVTFSF